jgi:hypothetical protein
MRLDETALAFPVGRSEAKRRAIHYRRERRRWRSVRSSHRLERQTVRLADMAP